MKKLIIGLCIGLMLGMSTNAFAAIGDTVSAVFAQFNYVVNSQTKSIDSPVLVYEGVSYVRTTDISNMLGYDVTYKADSRTIEFNKPEPVMTLAPTTSSAPTPTLEPTPTPVPTPLPTDANGNVIPTPTPDPNATPSPTPTASESPTPSPTPVATASPAPSNVAECQAIRDNYGAQIAVLGQTEISQGKVAQKKMQLEYARDAELTAAGCN